METRTILLIIDVQLGFVTAPLHWGPSRSNPSFELNLESLLTAYRDLIGKSPSRHKIIHIAHSSTTAASPLHPAKPGFAFQTFAKPNPGELVVIKNVNSAFIGTNLLGILRSHFGNRAGTLYVAGLTTDHCVSTTVRMAGNLGAADGSEQGETGEVILIEDATAAWKKGEGAAWADAEIVHSVHVESLREFATVSKTNKVLGDWKALQ